MALEIDLNGHRYSIGKLSAKQQFHMSRRIAPIVPTLIPVFVRLRQAASGSARIRAAWPMCSNPWPMAWPR